MVKAWAEDPQPEQEEQGGRRAMVDNTTEARGAASRSPLPADSLSNRCPHR